MKLARILPSALLMFSVFTMTPTSYGFDDKDSKTTPAKEVKKEKPKDVTIIHAGTLLADANNSTLTEQTIVIEGKKVKSVIAGYRTAEQAGNKDAKIIDMKDKFVMAGMMDVHVHLSSSRPRNPKANSADHALAAVKNASKTLMAGFTTVRDLGTSDDSLYKLRKLINTGDIPGPRIYMSGRTIGVGGNKGDMECNGPESCRRTTRDNIRDGADWIKIYASCSGFQTCSKADGAPVFFKDEIDAIFAVAKKYKIPVAAHTHPRDSALFVLNYDLKSIEHGTFMTKKALKAMKKKGVYFVPTAAVQDFLDKMRKNKKTTAKTIAHNDLFQTAAPKTILAAYKMGVPMATGSDAGVAPHGKNYREAERLVEMGISKADALKMTTVNAANLLGKSDEIGTISAGKYADIIAIDGNPLETIKDIRKVTFVMKEGRVYKSK